MPTLNATPSQDSFTEYLETQYPHVPVFPDGMIDTQEGVLRFSDNSIKPFIVIWYSNARHLGRKRGFANAKLDSYMTGADVVVVARSGTEARVLLNDIGDRLIDWKPENSGRVTKGAAIWRDSRAVLDNSNKPSRWASTDRFQWGIQHSKT